MRFAEKACWEEWTKFRDEMRAKEEMPIDWVTFRRGYIEGMRRAEKSKES